MPTRCLNALRHLVTLFVLLLVACSTTASPTSVGDSDGPGAPDQEPSADFTNWLNGYGNVLTPGPPPAGAENWRAAVADIYPDGGRVESAIFGLVTCFDPSRNCANRGLVRPGETKAIWVVSFADDADGCPVWATVDATTGEFITGTSGPC